MVKMKTTIKTHVDKDAKWWKEKYHCEIVVNERTMVYEKARTKAKLIKKVEYEICGNIWIDNNWVLPQLKKMLDRG